MKPIIFRSIEMLFAFFSASILVYLATVNSTYLLFKIFGVGSIIAFVISFWLWDKELKEDSKRSGRNE